MPFDPARHHRRSIRLKGYDYALPGAYFITLCTHERASLFGEIVEGVMIPNPYGQLVIDHWAALPCQADHVLVDAFVLMPNHVHGIVVLGEDSAGRGVHGEGQIEEMAPFPGHGGQSRRGWQGTRPGSLAAIVQNWKMLTTRRINHLRRTPGAAVWQANYYEHIIRSEEEWRAIRQYIADNPRQWQHDVENPSQHR